MNPAPAKVHTNSCPTPHPAHSAVFYENREAAYIFSHRQKNRQKEQLTRTNWNELIPSEFVQFVLFVVLFLPLPPFQLRSPQPETSDQKKTHSFHSHMPPMCIVPAAPDSLNYFNIKALQTPALPSPDAGRGSW